MTTTVRHVAMRASVSVATVSRVLNSPSLVSSKTKDRVMAAISELQYSPNLAAVALGRTPRKLNPEKAGVLKDHT
jgi:LacI family transcriptional regulator